MVKSIAWGVFVVAAAIWALAGHGDEDRDLASLIDRPEVGGVLVAVFDQEGDRIASKGDRIGVDDPVRIASITKTFTAALVMTLVEDGILDLESPAAGLVPEVSEGVTVRHLLTHQSGLPEHFDLAVKGSPESGDGTRWTPDQLLGLIAGRPLEFQPGTATEYRNSNYLVLGMIVEAATGQPFHEALRDRVLDPAGLRDTYLSSYETGPEPLGGYTDKVEGVDVMPTTFEWSALETGAWANGGLISTAADLDRFFSALMAGRIVSPHLVAEMKSDGLGLRSYGSSGYGHTGELPGSVTMAASDGAGTFVFIATLDSLRDEMEPTYREVRGRASPQSPGS